MLSTIVPLSVGLPSTEWMIWIRLFVPLLAARGVIVIVGAPLFGPSCAFNWWMWKKFCVGWSPAGILNFHSRICHSSQLPCTFAQVELFVIDFISLRWRSTVPELQRSPSITGSMWMSKRNTCLISDWIEVDRAVHAVDVPAEAARAIGMLGEVESEPPHVRVDRAERLSHDRGIRVHRRRPPVALAARSQQRRPHARAARSSASPPNPSADRCRPA